MKKNDKSKKGIVIYCVGRKSYYYINAEGTHVWIENIKLIDTDPAYKDIITKTAKLYTERGFRCSVEPKLFLDKNASMAAWISLDDFTRSKAVSLSIAA